MYIWQQVITLKVSVPKLQIHRLPMHSVLQNGKQEGHDDLEGLQWHERRYAATQQVRVYFLSPAKISTSESRSLDQNDARTAMWLITEMCIVGAVLSTILRTWSPSAAGSPTCPSRRLNSGLWTRTPTRLTTVSTAVIRPPLGPKPTLVGGTQLLP